MGCILRCLVCITAMMSAVLSQRYPFQFAHPANIIGRQQGRDLHYTQPITSDNPRPEVREYVIERIQEHTIENGTYYPQINKRGALEAELSDRVVFPGPASNEPSSSKISDGPIITEECRKRGFCEPKEVANYPHTDVANLVDQLGEDRVKGFQNDRPGEDVQIAQRLGGSSTELESPLCDYDQRVIHPQSLPDKEGVWWFVLNQDGKPLQGFLAELCKNQNSSCSPIARFQKNYKATCKQKYVYRMVEAFDNGKHVQKQLRLPGCCSCFVTENKNPFKR